MSGADERYGTENDERLSSQIHLYKSGKSSRDWRSRRMVHADMNASYAQTCGVEMPPGVSFPTPMKAFKE